MRELAIRSVGRVHWLAFFGTLLICWSLLFAMSVPQELRALETVYGLEFIEALCSGLFGASGFWSTWAMWALMSAAMMAPTALPALRVYDDLGQVSGTDFGKLLGGYLTVWIGFSAIAAILQVALHGAGLIGTFGQSLSLLLTMALLIGAGLYQFSPMKEACLARCRAPLTFFIQHWEEGPFRNGLRMGADCVGCCWALMLLGFVGGTMNLVFMGLALLLMTLEKLPEIGRYLTRPLGGVLIASALVLPLI